MLYEKNEQWTCIYVPIGVQTGFAVTQYTWAGPHVIEALKAIAPGKHCIMWDHDAAPTCLWEVAEILQRAVGFAYPQRDPLLLATFISPAWF